MTRRALVLGLGFAAAACAPVEPSVPEQPGVRRFGIMVSDIGGCSTSAVAGLSAQLVEEQNCLRPGVLVSFAGTPNLSVPSYVNALLEPPAATALVQAAGKAKQPIAINSAFRTLAQQYLLKKWEGSCGISIAASPGNSNHETGLAIDVDNHAESQSALESAGWVWFGAGDAVHFDWKGAGAIDLRMDSVLAFQRLWNRNHPADLIDEDGDYGPATEARLGQSPAEGFPIGAQCDPTGDLAPAVDLAQPPDLREAVDGGIADAAGSDDASPGRGKTVHGGCAAAGHLDGGFGALLLALALRRRGRNSGLDGALSSRRAF